MKLFKLTDKEGYTRRGQEGETKWEEGFTLRLNPCENPRLCTSDVIHFYTNPNLAFLLNPAHANIENPQLWEIEGDPVVENWDKGGTFSLTTVKKLPKPEWTKRKTRLVQIAFAKLCSTAANEAAACATANADANAVDAAHVAACNATYAANRVAACNADMTRDTYTTCAIYYAANAAMYTDYHINFAELADTAVKMVMGVCGLQSCL